MAAGSVVAEGAAVTGAGTTCGPVAVAVAAAVAVAVAARSVVPLAAAPVPGERISSITVAAPPTSASTAAIT